MNAKDMIEKTQLFESAPMQGHVVFSRILCKIKIYCYLFINIQQPLDINEFDLKTERLGKNNS